MEFDQIFRFVLALVFVLGLIGAFAVFGKRIGFTARATKVTPGAGKRLSVVEVQSIDAKRRLVLVRRDDTEHLVLLGTERELLVESGIPVTETEHDDHDAASNVGNVRSFLGKARRAARPSKGDNT